MDHNGVDMEQLLFIQISKGGAEAFKRLFELYRVRIFGFVYSFTHSAVDAEEIVQETFLSLWNARFTLNKVENPKAYIFRIAKNKTLNHLEKVSRRNKLMQHVWANIEWSQNTVDDQLNVNECQELLNKAIGNLSRQKQEIFILSRDRGLSHEEIASQIGLSKSRVKNIMVETLRYLRWYLSKHQVTILKTIAVLLFVF